MSAPVDLEALSRRLTDLSGSAYVIRGCRRADTGYANQTWLLDSSPEPLVVKVQQSPSLVYRRDPALEPQVLRALVGTGVPVPRLVVRDAAGEVFGRPWFAMEYVDGIAPPDEQLTGYAAQGWFAEATPARRTAIWTSFVDRLADLHSLPPETFGPDPRGGSHSEVLDYWTASLADVMPERPRASVQDKVLEWLRANAPVDADASPRACMADARPANVLVRNDHVAALLDWELAWVGNPRGDLGYHLFLDRRYAEAAGNRLPGLPSAADTWHQWEQRTGLSVGDPHYWEVFGAMVMTITATRALRHLYDLDADLVESRNPFVAEVAGWVGATP